MKKTDWKLAALAFGLSLFGAGITYADSSSTPVPTSSPLVLNVQTADGKTLQAPVLKFKALSLAVVTTLIKEGKMSASRAPENDPLGYVTFYLDKNTSADFVNWAKGNFSQTSGNGSTDSGEFTWPAKNGNAAETFKMQGLKVVGFVPAEGSDGIELVLATDKTEAFPPINFSKSKK
jgi:hypothetical protein